MRQSTSRHQTTMRDRLAMMAAIAMIGTACSGPNTITSTGISMIDEPKPTMPLMVPAARPTARTNSSSTRSSKGASTAPSEPPPRPVAPAEPALERIEVAGIGREPAHAVRMEGGHHRVVEGRGDADGAALGGDEAVQIVDLGPAALHHVLQHRVPAAAPAASASRLAAMPRIGSMR